MSDGVTRGEEVMEEREHGADGGFLPGPASEGGKSVLKWTCAPRLRLLQYELPDARAAESSCLPSRPLSVVKPEMRLALDISIQR